MQKAGVQDIVVSPGSRNGALIMHFSNHSEFNVYTIVDERVAGFFALGMARQKKQPVVVCSTSGSAVANYYPAVVEAFYQNTALIVLTADRPVDFVDIFDGQTIRQNNFFEQHAYESAQLADEESDDFLLENYKKIKSALQTCLNESGPVHINIPMQEPLYDSVESIQVDFDEFDINPKQEENIDFDLLANQWNSSERKLVLVGLHDYSEKFNSLINKLAADPSVIVLCESVSNISGEKLFNKIDQLIFNFNEKDRLDFEPEILLTIGQMIVSKKIKALLRSYKNLNHWHLDSYWQPDTYFTLKQKIKTNKESFLEQFLPKVFAQKSEYFDSWNDRREAKKKNHLAFLETIDWSDLKVFELLSNSIPEEFLLHFSNSSPIRYSQLFDFKNEMFCNRGTSGIDGCTSTAVGACVGRGKPTVLVTGDLSFFYDSNALWINDIPSNFRIILINNGGGNIFKIIPGPDTTGALEQSFEAKHNLNAEYLCKQFALDYSYAESEKELNSKLNKFFNDSGKPKVLEINTQQAENSEVLRTYFKTV